MERNAFKTYARKDEAYGLDPSFNNATIKVKALSKCSKSQLGYTDATIPDRLFKVLRNDPVFYYNAGRSNSEYVHVWPNKTIGADIEKESFIEANGPINEAEDDRIVFENYRDLLRRQGAKNREAIEILKKGKSKALDQFSFVGFSLLPEDDNILPIAISGTIKLLNTDSEPIRINDKIIWDYEYDVKLDRERERTDRIDGRRINNEQKFILRKLRPEEYDDIHVLRRVVGFAISNAKKGHFYRLVIVK